MKSLLTESSPSLAPYTGGRGHRGFIPGERIEALSELRAGDILVEVNHQFEAINTTVCLHGARHPHAWGQIAYFQWFGPHKTTGGYAQWDREIEGHGVFAPRTELYRAVLVEAGHPDHAYAQQEIAAFREYAAASRSFCFSPSPVPPDRTAAIEGAVVSGMVIHDNLDLE
jgi:hypothetical protein